jgi:hypothetical protein
MLTPIRAALAAAVLVSMSVGAFAEGTPTYTNVEVLSVDAQKRVIVVRNTDGRQQSFEWSPSVTGIADLRRGDHVILMLKGENDRQRVEAFTKATPSEPGSAARSKELARRSTETPVRASVSGTAAAPAPDAATEREERVADAFARRLQELSEQAARVDGLWAGFRTSCDAEELNLGGGLYQGSREWLSLWDDSVETQVDLSSGFCRDLFNQIVTRGQAINAAMAAAEDDARRTLQPGRLRELQRLYSLDWTGWGSAPPSLREQ